MMALKRRAGVLVVLKVDVVGPPRDQQPADGEVHRPRAPARVRRSPQGAEAEEQERNPEAEGERLRGGQEDKEGRLAGGGFGVAGRLMTCPSTIAGTLAWPRRARAGLAAFRAATLRGSRRGGIRRPGRARWCRSARLSCGVWLWR